MKVCLVVYDNDSYIHHFPMGLGYIASALRNAGHEVGIYNQDLYHYPESHLTEYLTHNRYDAVGLGFVAGYYPYRKMLKISAAINAVPNRPFYIIGGHGPAPEPEYFLKKSGADVVMIGEGDVSIVNLINALANKTSLSTVYGIAYMDEGILVQTPRQALIRDIDSIPFPAWDLFPMDYYGLFRIGNVTQNRDRVGIVLSGRGCPFHCNFCYRMDEGCRVRSNESILSEMAALKTDYHMNFIYFCDELLMTSVQRTVEFCEAVLESGLDLPWACNGRLNFAKPEVIKLMKKAGCKFINYGIEAVDDDALKTMHKALTVDQIVHGTEATLAEGIAPGFNIIWGNIGETREVLQKDVDFLLKYDDQGQFRTIRPVTPYPGTPLYDHAIRKGLLKGVEDFYENKHINQDLVSVNFTNLSDEDFNEALRDANSTLITRYYEKLQEKMMATCRNLYTEKNVAFRGFRQS